MNDNKQLFIHTSDNETAKQLRTMGYPEITSTGTDGFTFLNNTANYGTRDGINTSRVSFSSTLNI